MLGTYITDELGIIIIKGFNNPLYNEALVPSSNIKRRGPIDDKLAVA